MNTHTYEIIDAALRHPLVDVDVWGPKWKDWDPELTVAENIRRRGWKGISKRKHNEEDESPAGPEHSKARTTASLGREQDDWVSALKLVDSAVPSHDDDEATDEKDPGDVPNWPEEGIEDGCPSNPFDMVWTISDIFKQNDPNLGPMDCGSIFIQQLGDCHSLRCLKEWYPNVSNITVSKYAFELLELFDYHKLEKLYPGLDMQLYGHSPDSANPWDFYPIPWEAKTKDAQMFGFDGSCKWKWQSA